MKDIKKIQEFFSKSLDEGNENIGVEDFDRVVQAISQTNHPVTVLLTPIFGKNEIEIIVGNDAPDPIVDAMFNIIADLGYKRGEYSIVGDTSSLSRREYSQIRRINGGHKEYQRWEESVNEMDINDPVMMKLRADKAKLAKMKAANAGDDGNDAIFRKARANVKKLEALKAKRAQIMRDMEQEAEIEGGPIADRYGAMLNKIDKAIDLLSPQNKGDEYMSKDEIERRAAMISDPYADYTSKTNAMFGLEEDKPVANPNKHIKGIQIQLDQLGVKYEMDPKNKVQPFKVIYKPVNKDDDFYDKFNDIVFRYNLKGVVKTSMNEAFGEQYYLRVRLKDSPEAMKAFDDFIGKNDFRINKGGDQFSTDDVKAGIKLYRHLTDRFVKVYDHNLPLEDKTIPVYEAEEDQTDIVAMDVPLFIRVLEYAREDAQADMDLHDLAEKAITGTKEAGVLTMDNYDMLVGEKESVDEAELTEANVPSNIAEFAKRKGISSLVRKVAGWAEKVGARITGGTAIGKYYDTLILDMGYQTSDIRINCDDETVELYYEPVNSFADFKRVFMEEEARKQAEHDEEQLRREQGLEEVVSKVIAQIKEDRPGLWANIHAKRERGEKPSRKGSKAYKDAVKAGKKINAMTEIEDGGAEEKAFDAELMAVASGIANTLDKELKTKQGDKEQLDEALVTATIAAVLTGNALIGFISKVTKILAKKLNWKKGEDFAEKVHHWAHDNETAFQEPIRRVLSFFIKDKTKVENITKGVYALIIISMAAGYGADAVASLSKASWFKGALASLKTIAKGDEAIATAYPVIKSIA